jgi:hypothetical protein
MRPNLLIFVGGLFCAFGAFGAFGGPNLVSSLGGLALGLSLAALATMIANKTNEAYDRATVETKGGGK